MVGGAGAVGADARFHSVAPVFMGAHNVDDSAFRIEGFGFADWDG